jgi:N-acylneuraminate cytidylyltransferase
VAGLPLIAWTIKAALQSELIDRCVVSSDDSEIIARANEFGAETPFVRPAEFARDDSPYQDVIIHALSALPGYDYLAFLNPTAPLRTSEDIDACIRHCLDKNAPVCVSVCKAAKHPAWMFTIAEDGSMKSVIGSDDVPPRRQDLPDVYALNGAVNVARTEWFLENRTFFGPETVAFVMPGDRSIDIDSETDLQVADFLLNRRREP